jgi:hypothetical protein
VNKRHFFVRPVQKTDADSFVEWSRNNKAFDPGVVKYPSTTIRVVYNSEGPVLFGPVQRPLFLDSLAINPGATNEMVSAGMKALTQDAVSQAHINGAGEIYFVASDENTAAFAERHGYEKIKVPVYRVKISDLEKPQIPE